MTWQPGLVGVPFSDRRAHQCAQGCAVMMWQRPAHGPATHLLQSRHTGPFSQLRFRLHALTSRSRCLLVRLETPKDDSFKLQSSTPEMLRLHVFNNRPFIFQPKV